MTDRKASSSAHFSWQLAPSAQLIEQPATQEILQVDPALHEMLPLAPRVIVQLASGGATSKKPTLGQTVVIALALLLKLPLIYAGWVLSQRLGPFAPAWFLAGLALVYCALVWRTVLAVRD